MVLENFELASRKFKKEDTAHHTATMARLRTVMLPSRLDSTSAALRLGPPRGSPRPPQLGRSFECCQAGVKYVVTNFLIRPIDPTLGSIVREISHGFDPYRLSQGFFQAKEETR